MNYCELLCINSVTVKLSLVSLSVDYDLFTSQTFPVATLISQHGSTIYCTVCSHVWPCCINACPAVCTLSPNEPQTAVSYSREAWE